MRLIAEPCNKVSGEVLCPGDKSISQRIVMLGSLLDHDLKVENFLSDDHHFALIHKNEWLSKPKMPEKLLSKKDCIEQLNEALKKSPRSLYLACYKNSELMSQGFVVHNNWPDFKS